MTTITAQTILRSRHALRPDKVLSTLLLRYPRPIHAEFMTHRQLSRNAASSRAIPTSKLIQDVIDNPFIPTHWGKNQKGMQAGEEHDAFVSVNNIEYGPDVFESFTRENAWLAARDYAIAFARGFAEANYHKQIVNRILEPFAHITVLASGTEWSNFLALRDHPDAEPHIQILAQQVRKELDREDNIQTLQPGEWHMPFITEQDYDFAYNRITANGVLRKVPSETELFHLLVKKSVSCCASTSYKTVEGFDMTFDKAIELHDKLVGSTPLHASPAEPVAQADSLGRYELMAIGGEHEDDEELLSSGEDWDHPDEHGNFCGFRQYRKQLPNECL